MTREQDRILLAGSNRVSDYVPGFVPVTRINGNVFNFPISTIRILLRVPQPVPTGCQRFSTTVASDKDNEAVRTAHVVRY